MLARICAGLGSPGAIRVNPGGKFISGEPDLWVCVNGVTLGFSRPGKPTDKAFIETFDRQFCSE